MLRCPCSGSPLIEASPELLDRLNQAIRAGTLYNRLGARVHEPVEAALVNADQSCFYPVVHAVPQLLADEAIVGPLPVA